LQETAARAYGVPDPAMVVGAPGTQLLISLLPRLLPLASVAILSPTYGEHEAAWAEAGCRIVRAGCIAAFDQAVGDVVCNPNNPDGRRTDPAQLLALADRLADRGGFLLVDEAFADLEEPPISIAPALPHPGFIVLRSFGKIYGLAGLRLGFALASVHTAAYLRSALGPWAVSGPAIAAGRLALADSEWRRRAASRLDQDTERLDRCTSPAGLTLVGGTRLFRLYQGEDATELYDRLGRAGILARRFAGHPTWLRFGIPESEEAWSRLECALRRYSASDPNRNA
jgi:cobalamin biosynthetic protein CobC